MVVGISGKIGSGKDTIGEIIRFLWDIENTKDGQYLTVDDFIEAPSDVDYSNPYEIKKYAGKLKDIACLLIGCTREQLEDREFKEKPIGPEWMKWFTEDGLPPKKNHAGVGEVLTPRKLLQLLGTEAGRNIIHPNIWVNALFANYKKIAYNWDCDGNTTVEGYPKWIITDVRFPNEAQAIKDRGGIVIRVNRNKQCGSCENIFIGNAECPACGSGNWVYGNIDSNHTSETALDDYDGFDYVIENDGTVQDLIDKVKALNIVQKNS